MEMMALQSRPGSVCMERWTSLGTIFLAFLCAQTLSLTLPVPSVLYTNQSVRSPGGIFELGFQTDSQNNFMLAIWYAQPILGTVVWVADRKAKLTSSALLTVTTNGLVISDTASPGVAVVLYSLTTPNSNEVAGADLQDSGNLVLVDKTNSSATLWQSFDTPTDTLLPGQSYSTSNLRSWNGPGDWDEGKYGCLWDSNHFFALVWFSGVANLGVTYDLQYYTDSQPSASAHFDSSGKLFVMNETSSRLLLNTTRVDTVNGNASRVRRVTIDQDGGLRIYSWAINSSSSWYVEADLMHNHCLVFGTCGPNAYCTYTAAGTSYLDWTYTCQCPEGFVNEMDFGLGCVREYTIPWGACNDPQQLMLTNVTSVDYPWVGDYYSFHSANLTACQHSCLTSCSCDALVYSFEAGVCWLKSGDVYNGYAYPHPNYGDDRSTFFKVDNPGAPVPNTDPSTASIAERRILRRFLILFLGIVIGIGILVICFCCIRIC